MNIKIDPDVTGKLKMDISSNSSATDKPVKSARVIGLTPEQEQICLALASEGKTAKHIRDRILISQNKFRKHCFDHPLFEKAFREARQEGLEEIADSLQTLADEEHDVLRARLKSENIRWILSKRKPHVYGDRIEVNLNQSIDIGQALTDARNRALPDIISHVVTKQLSNESDDEYTADTAANESLDDLLS